MFKAKIIRSDFYQGAKPLLAALTIVVFVCFLLVGYRRIPGLLQLLGFEEFEIIVLIILLLAFGVYGVIELVRRQVNGYGFLQLTKDGILLSVNGEETLYAISEVSQIEITHNSFVGPDYPQENFKGQNFLRFVHNSLRYTCEFQVDSIFLSNKLKQALDAWAHNDVAFIYRQV